MKPIVLLLLLFTAVPIQAQEWGSVDKNKVTLKEISPVWEGCEGQKGAALAQCFNQKLTQHVVKNFKYPAEAYKKNKQGRVIVEFLIDTQGMVEIQNVSGADPLLQEEARRNISLIPKMSVPGMYGGKPKAIKYTVPFDFKTGKQ
ncbi:MAG: energy transducer TonB [Flavobacteriaceae bacterium]|jgi:periplasmic protein TonB|nr:energy transducer TonB [Flavobacteriaceae bacterium]MDG1064174.1 energy transducer TonB [Flavobacteriaceae bacterium]MDG1962471.1 energy transducer TonB [Flavobacteriaceae bacterium]